MKKLEVSNADALRSELKDMCCQTPDSRVLHRMHCILLVGHGASCYQVGALFRENPRTIERWVHQYNEYGVEGLRDDRTGRPAKVRDDQLKQLKADIRKSPRQIGYRQPDWDGRLLRFHLEHRHGVELSLRQCQRLLHQLK